MKQDTLHEQIREIRTNSNAENPIYVRKRILFT